MLGCNVNEKQTKKEKIQLLKTKMDQHFTRKPNLPPNWANIIIN